MASSATLITRILTRALNPIPSSIRSFSSTFYKIVKPPPLSALHQDFPDDRHRSGLLIHDEEDALYLQKSMPGLCKEDINIEILQGTWNKILVIKGEPGGYKTHLNLPPACRDGKGWCVMEHGVLRMRLPKTKKPNDKAQEAQSGENPWEVKEHLTGGRELIVGYQLQDE